MPSLAQRITELLKEDSRSDSPAALSKTFTTGEVIFSSGDASDGLYLIETGRVRVMADSGNQDLLPLATIEAGELVGEMGVIDDAPRSATAIAEADTTARFLSREEFLGLLKNHPELALHLIGEFSQRLRTLNRKYIDETLQAERLALMGRFAATIVHDFRSPLSVISLGNEIVCSPGANPDLRTKFKGRIDQQVSRMCNMLDELLDFSRPTNQKQKVPALGYREFIDDLFEELNEETVRRGVTLKLGNTPPMVSVHIAPQRLSRLFFNLVNNAVQAMPNGGTITLRFAIKDGELQTEVADTGDGIAPEIAANLFKPFATHGKANGTGLGLSICRKIIEDHGGRIAARNEPGNGAVFSFTLPLLQHH